MTAIQKMMIVWVAAAMAILAADVSAFTSPAVSSRTAATPTTATSSTWPKTTMSMTEDDDEETADDAVDVDDVVDSAYELLASVDSIDATATSAEPAAPETADEPEATTSTSSADLSWSELFQEAGNVAALLGGAAVKKASEVVSVDVSDISAPKLNLSAVDIAIPKTVTNMNFSQITQGTSEWKNAFEGAFDGIESAFDGFSFSNAASAASKVFKADVAIDYDGAAKLAYQEWQDKFGSGGQAALPPDEEDETPPVVYSVQERFKFFQERYNNVTIQNVIEKKKQRDGLLVDENGTAIPMQLTELDKYADLSPEEYARVLKSLEPKSWGEIFGGLANSFLSTASSVAETVKEKAPAKAKPVPKKAVAKAASPTTSIFGSFGTPTKAKAATKKAPAKKKAVPTKKSPPRKPTSKVRGAEKAPPARSTISLFSFPKKSSETKKATKVKAAPTTKKAASNPSFSFFGGGGGSGSTPQAVKKKTATAKAKAAVKGPPTLTNWTQNPDGSITGRISNSPNFRTGTKITTSPVRKGARKGSIIKTGSGSQYKLL